MTFLQKISLIKLNEIWKPEHSYDLKRTFFKILVSGSSLLKKNTAKNTVISPDFLVWKFCGKAQFLHSFRRFTRNYVETVPFHKIFTPGNQVKLRYFSQWNSGNRLHSKYIRVRQATLNISWRY